MQPNELGKLVELCWSEIPQHYSHVELGAFQIMPNHFHGLIRIVRPGGKGLGEVVNVFKGAVTREARRSVLSGFRLFLMRYWMPPEPVVSRRICGLSSFVWSKMKGGFEKWVL